MTVTALVNEGLTLTPREFAEMFDVDAFLPVHSTTSSFPARVFSKVEVTASCWYWTGALDDDGYGVVQRGRRGSGTMRAHLAVWELLIDAVPAGLVFDHLCRNRPCVNPEHGEFVTHEENLRRGFGISTLNAMRMTCRKGHPLDGRLGGKGGKATARYCKTCARARAHANYHQIKGAA